MAHFAFAAFFGAIGEDRDLLGFAVFDHSGVHRGPFDIGGADFQFLAVVQGDHLVEGDGRFLGGIQLFNEQNVAVLHFVLFPAGFNDGVHVVTGTCLLLSLAVS